MKALYWLIYATYEGRKAKPFSSKESLENYITNNKKYITVISKTETYSDGSEGSDSND